MKHKKVTATTPALHHSDHAVIKCLQDGITSVSDICAELDYPIFRVTAILTGLEIFGHVKQTDSLHYIATN